MSFARTGLMLGFLSLMLVQNLVRKRMGRIAGWTFTVITLLTGSLGIYIGRYVRLNSWDVVGNPVRVYVDIFQHFSDGLLRIEMMVMTFQYGIFLLLGYLTIKVIVKIPDRMAL